MKSYSNNHRQQKIVRFVLYVYLQRVRGVDINHVVEREYAVDVFLHLFMITKGMKLLRRLVPFAESLLILLMRR